LSKAQSRCRKKVIVKRLDSIQNFGGMDVLCTDKTGTLTIDRVILEIYCDVFKNENEEVLRDAYPISHFKPGLKTFSTAPCSSTRTCMASWASTSSQSWTKSRSTSRAA
jgi:P-type E1-E2 ATPase